MCNPFLQSIKTQIESLNPTSGFRRIKTYSFRHSEPA